MINARIGLRMGVPVRRSAASRNRGPLITVVGRKTAREHRRLASTPGVSPTGRGLQADYREEWLEIRRKQSRGQSGRLAYVPQGNRSRERSIPVSKKDRHAVGVSIDGRQIQ